MGTAEDEFGRNVRRERERRGWTQAKLSGELSARGIELHPSAVQKIEDRDIARPRAIRLDEARAIAAIFRMSLDEMFVPTNPSLDAVFSAGYWLNDLNDEPAHVGTRVARQLRDAADRRYGDDEQEIKEAVDSALELVVDVVRRLVEVGEEGQRLMRLTRKVRKGGG